MLVCVLTIFVVPPSLRNYTYWSRKNPASIGSTIAIRSRCRNKVDGYFIFFFLLSILYTDAILLYYQYYYYYYMARAAYLFAFRRVFFSTNVSAAAIVFRYIFYISIFDMPKSFGAEYVFRWRHAQIQWYHTHTHTRTHTTHRSPVSLILEMNRMTITVHAHCDGIILTMTLTPLNNSNG